MNDIHQFFATSPKGMEDLLEAELIQLGASHTKSRPAGVHFSGPMELAYRACLWSRLANRILFPLQEFPAASPEELYDQVSRVKWTDHMEVQGTFAVDFHTTRSQIRHSHYGALKVKDAIVDQFRHLTGERPSIDTDKPDIRVNLFLDRDQATLSLDLSGESLHRRGYRLASVAAPLKENLAAAILIRAGWPQIATAGGGLMDPMCGSGTLAIEAAMMAGDLAPGLIRNYYGFFRWKQFEDKIWEELLEEAETREREGLEKIPPIIGYDASTQAIHAALANMERAGLHGFLHFERQDFADCVPHKKTKSPGLFIINPPYGERLGEVQNLEPLYQAVGLKLKEEFADWHATIFTGNMELGKKMGIRAQKIYTLYNGLIKCGVLNFHIKPETFIDESRAKPKLAAPIEVEPLSEGAQMFANRLKKNRKRLAKWVKREGLECYRLYDQDLPEYAVAVDLYGSSVHVQEYEPPPTIDLAKADQRLQEIMEALPQVLEIPKEKIFLKVRKRQKGRSQYNTFSDTGEFITVQEYGARFQVNLGDYLDTGLFLDHRLTRKMIQELAKGRRFLNLFAYTGTATVHAAIGGAKSTTTVDMSKTYLNWARRNLALNGFDFDKHHFEQSDCKEWLDLCRWKYDLIFVDPPTFSNSKRTERPFEVQKDYPALIRRCMKLLEKDGILIFSNNFRRFKMDPESLPEYEIEDLTRQTIPPDFERNPRIHHCWKVTYPTMKTTKRP